MIVIAGGTGFLGQPLAARLAADGYAVTVLTRKSIPTSTGTNGSRPAAGSIVQVQWRPDGWDAACQQRAVPARAEELRFAFSYPKLDLALQALFA